MEKINYVDLHNLELITKGDSTHMMKYLKQFRDLIPERLEQLKYGLDTKDRILLRQILHKMSPQLQFFGIHEITIPIQRLEFEYQTMPFIELEVMVIEIITKLDQAVLEVAKLINPDC